MTERWKKGFTKTLRNILLWRRKYLTDKQFIIVLSILVGFSSGMVAVILKNSVHYIQLALKFGLFYRYENYVYFIYPAIGILLTVLIIRYVLRRPVGHGIPNTLKAISKNDSNMPKTSIYSSIITSMITVGFGGSVGLEGPTVGSSSAIGSNYGKLGRMNYKTTTLLLGCGAASAMSGIFNAPIAAIVFALEVIMLDLTVSSLIPLLMASVAATLTSSFMLGDDVLFNIPVLEKYSFSDIPFFILLGILTGLLSVYFCKTYWNIERRFELIDNQYKRFLIGSVLLGSLLFLFPPLYGEGFSTIKYLLNGKVHELFEGSLFYDFRFSLWGVIFFLLAIVLVKSIATTITLGAGGVGGVFAPSMFIGSVFGFVFAKICNAFSFINLSERNYTLVGMGGVIAGILHAPLTGLFLIAEITGGYQLVVPLMLTSSIAYLTSRYFQPYSLYTLQLAEKGELITHNKDKAVLTLMKLHSEVERDFSEVSPEQTLGELVKIVSTSRRNIFPVVGAERELVGIVLLDDIRQIMFEPAKYDKVKVKEIMGDYPEMVTSTDSMDIVMQKFNESGAWNLPVIDNGKYIGFVSKSKLFNAYRKVLQDFTHE
jgi:CIC family chloride channel protein